MRIAREDNEVAERIGTNIRNRRATRKLTQEALADAVNITQPHLSNIERGDTSVSVEVLDRLCDALETSADFLLGRR